MIYECPPLYSSKSNAREAVAKLAISEGLVDLLKQRAAGDGSSNLLSGNGQPVEKDRATVPYVRRLQGKLHARRGDTNLTKLFRVLCVDESTKPCISGASTHDCVASTNRRSECDHRGRKLSAIKQRRTTFSARKLRQARSEHIEAPHISRSLDLTQSTGRFGQNAKTVGPASRNFVTQNLAIGFVP